MIPDKYKKSTTGINQVNADFLRDLMRLIREDAINRSHGIIVEPDTYGVDFFFLMGFWTEELFLEFSLVEQDFMEHCGNKLAELNSIAWYDEAYIGITSPRKTLYSHVLRLIYNGAKSGDAYCIELLKNLYKTYHKKEYRQIKNFSELSTKDILCITTDTNTTNGFFAFVRILGISQFFDIRLNEDCAIWYKLLNEQREKYLANVDRLIKPKTVSDEFYKDAALQIDTWNELAEKDEGLVKRYKESVEFTNNVFKMQGFSNHYDKLCVNFENGREHLISTLAILKRMDPKREYTFEEVQVYSHIRDLVIALTETADCFEGEVDYLLGEEIDEEFTKEAWFKKTAVDISTKQKEDVSRLLNIAPVKSGNVTKDDYLQEINELRVEHERLKREVKSNYETKKSLEDELAEKKALLQQLQEDNQELIRMRDYIRSTTVKDNLPEERYIKEQRQFLSDKKIMIIGGPENWHNRIKESFPNWTVIQPDKFSTINPSITKGYDEVFLYTGFVGHAECNYFIKHMNSSGIPYWYLNNTNMDRVIQDIYLELNK